MARSVSRAIMRSSSVGTTSMVTGESSVEMRQTSSAPRASRLLARRADAHAAQALQARARTAGAALADAAGEDQDVQSAHRGHIGADVLAHPVAEGLERQQGAVVARVRRLFDFAHVVRDARDPQQAALRVEQLVDLRRRSVLPPFAGRRARPDRDRRERVPMISPSPGVRPMEVSTERPWSMAQTRRRCPGGR